ncbi:MAG: TonB family protein [Candidatus Angelobacter sp.]
MGISFEQDRQEWNTLMQSQPARRRSWSFSVCVSTAFHLLVVIVFCWPTVPVFVRPALIARGEAGSATPSSVVLYVPNDLQIAASSSPPLLSLPIPARKKPKTKLRKRINVIEEADKTPNPAEVGSENGSAYDGLASGDEVKPALPVAFQDLKIPRSELPSGIIQGDVIVEITIDAQGSVVDERLLQGLGHGVDDRVIAVLRDWRFHPATRNGVAIPSKHDVHFHFPS